MAPDGLLSPSAHARAARALSLLYYPTLSVCYSCCSCCRVANYISYAVAPGLCGRLAAAGGALWRAASRLCVGRALGGLFSSLHAVLVGPDFSCAC
eukprot:3693583-Prymnesium_polylepis.2